MRLSKQERIAIIIILVIVIIALGIFLFIVPAAQQIESTLKNLDNKQKEYDAAVEKQATKGPLREQIIEAYKTGEHIADMFFPEMKSYEADAPDDATRSAIMPVNRACGVDRLLDACRRYFEKTGRRISFEYAMIRDVNDTPEHAALLGDRLAGTNCHVNLIPLNDVPESKLRPSTPETIKRFIAALERRGINVTVRRKLGPDIEASCGQLRRGRMKTQ